MASIYIYIYCDLLSALWEESKQSVPLCNEDHETEEDNARQKDSDEDKGNEDHASQEQEECKERHSDNEGSEEHESEEEVITTNGTTRHDSLSQ